MARPDAAALSIFDSVLASVAEEMGATLGRSALSPNIRERRDFSCAVFDPTGNLIAQAAHIPVHLGAMPESVAAVRSLAPFAPGDLALLNDPYLGGTHLPDVTMVSPVFERSSARPGRLLGFVASRAHQADIGGMAPGSMPLARELVQEGLIIPPLKLMRRGVLNQEALALILRNVRTPDERRGDLDAQMAAHRVGERRLQEIAAKYGPGVLRARMRDLLDYAERLTRAALARIPPGTYRFRDALDNDGISRGVVPIQVALVAGQGELVVDFTGSAAERHSSVNAVAAVTRSAVYYVVRCLLGENAPMNAGCFRPVTVILPESSVVNASPGRAVSAGNVETSQRIVDAVLGALGRALPDIVPAASSGTMNNIAVGGFDSLRRRPFAYYETLAGGAGGGPKAPGLDAVHTHMTNTLNTPVESLEMTYPFRVLEYSLREGSGGAGLHRGGDGLIRAYEFLTETDVTLMTDRRRTRPWGARGGRPGAAGRNSLVRDGKERRLPGKTQFRASPGDVLRVQTPGGGGWGKAGRGR
ncbi:MAG TPA: hydantoinase B/oxoprolinase family protein [Dehalococcoidia bacterium]|nr:hydantoinase B/oxoprolinase family protein [Dehalococcoidia bacterium]